MPSVTVSNKGQVVTPAELRRQLAIQAGSQVEVSAVNGKIEIVLKHLAGSSRHEDGFGIFKYAGPSCRLADLDVAELMRREREAEDR